MFILSLICFILYILQLCLPKTLRYLVKSLDPYVGLVISMLLAIFTLGTWFYYIHMLVWVHATRTQISWAVIVFVPLVLVSLRELIYSVKNVLDLGDRM